MLRGFAVVAMAVASGGQTPALAQLIRRRSRQAGGRGRRRRAGATRPQIATDHRRGKTLGAGPVAGRRRARRFSRRFEVHHDLGSRNGAARTDVGPRADGHRRRATYQRNPHAKIRFRDRRQGRRAMSGIRVAAQLRELQRIAPMLLLKMLDDPGSVTFEGGVRSARRHAAGGFLQGRRRRHSL